MPEHLHFLSHAATDMGLQRPANQDAVNVYQPVEDDIDRYERGFLYVLSDGMGGHQAGEVASRYAVDALIYHYYESPWRNVPENLNLAYRDVNRDVYDKQLSEPVYKGMGATLVVAALRGTELDIANVGDSRAYLLRDNELIQLTQDHSWVAEKVISGELDPSQAEDHPNKSWITRNIGGESSVEPDIFSETLYAGDTILLCSDGLHGPVPDVQIQEILTEYWRNPAGATRALIDRANEYGGPDNIAAIVINVVANGARPQDQYTPAAHLLDDKTVPLPRFQKRSRLSNGLRLLQNDIPTNPLLLMGLAAVFLFCIGLSVAATLWFSGRLDSESSTAETPTPIVTRALESTAVAAGDIETGAPAVPATEAPSETLMLANTATFEPTVTASPVPTETPQAFQLEAPFEVEDSLQNIDFPPSLGGDSSFRLFNAAIIGTDELGEQWAYIREGSIRIHDNGEEIPVERDVMASGPALNYVDTLGEQRPLERNDFAIVTDDEQQRLSWSRAFSFSERLLAFVCEITINTTTSLDICIYEKESEKITILGAPNSDEVDPAWSGDNNLLFASSLDGNNAHSLYKVAYPLADPEAGQSTPVEWSDLMQDYGISLDSSTIGDFRWPSTSASAGTVAFQATGCPSKVPHDDLICDDSDIYMIEKDGGIYKITAFDGADERPAFSPDGNYLAFGRAPKPSSTADAWNLKIADLSTDCFDFESPELFCSDADNLLKTAAVQGVYKVPPRPFWVTEQ